MEIIIRHIFAIVATLIITHKAYKSKSLNKSGCLAG
jgi:hypothetical protein